jgi:serine/threonine-protein kinase
MADMIAGTPHYVAPEQVRGETVTARSDIYSLGVLAYVLFLGRAPFDHESSAEILKQHVRLLPPPPKERWADIPPALDATILAMLAKDPHARPALGEIAKVLRAARPGATPPPLPLAARGTRPPVAAASVGYETLEIEPADVLGRMVVLPTLEKRWWIGAAVAACLLAGGLAWRLATGGRVAAAAPVRPAPALVTAAPVAGGEGRLDVAPPVSFDPIAQAIAMLDAGRATCAPAMLACPPVAAPEP